jgi:hypothetical protein
VATLGRPLCDVIVDQTISLTTDAAYSRLFLPGFTKPGSASLFGGVWPDLSEAFDRLDDAGVDVIVDAGRIGAHGLPTPLLEYAALSCFVLRSNLRSVMSARVHAVTLREQSGQITGGQSIGLIIVGEGEPYGKHEISRALGMPVIASIAHDQAAARHLSDGHPRPRKYDSSPLVKTLRTSATDIYRRLQQTADRIRS